MKFLRESRLEAAKRNLERIPIDERIKGRLKALIEERLGSRAEFEESERNLSVVALSGGADSSSSLFIAKHAGLNPTAVTVLLNRQWVNPPEDYIKDLCLRLDVRHEFLDASQEFETVASGALSGRYHPCGRCHGLVKKKAFDHAKNKDVGSVIFGDLLSTGSESVKMVDGMARINLPAMLAMTKEETRNLSGRGEEAFGCLLQKEVARKFPHMKRFSVGRVLRETKARVLTQKQASAYIDGILFSNR